jgi:hypothetical protein
MSQAWAYKIQVHGRLSERWHHWFEDMDISVESGNLFEVTTLKAVLVDQAALLGILQRLYTLGLPLLFVRREDAGTIEATAVERRIAAGNGI